MSGRGQISNTDGVFPFVIREAHHGPYSIQFSSHKLPRLIRVLFSAGIGVNGASNRRFIITGPFGGRQQFPRRAHHQTFINTAQELGKAVTVPGRAEEVVR